MIKKKIRKIRKAKREIQTQFLSQAIQLEESVNPHIIRATMSMVSLAILVFIVWAGFTNINEIARAPGEVVPQGYQQTVQHLEGGIVKSIHVREGEFVKAGQILVTLSDASVQKDLERARIKELGLKMEAERLRAYVDNREPDFTKFGDVDPNLVSDQTDYFKGMVVAREKEEQVIRDQMEEQKQSILSLEADLATAEGNLKIINNVYERRRSLNKKGYSSDMQVLDDERQINQISGDIKRIKNQIIVARREITQYQTRLVSLSARNKDEAYGKISTVENEQAQNAELISKLEERVGRMDTKSPVSGMIKGLAINTIGAVIQPGQTIMEIVPFDKKMEIATKISPQDIGHIKVGQPVQVKFSTYDFSRYGFVTGKLEQISATTFTEENGGRYYRGRIELDKNYVGEDQSNKILPGMTVMVDVITGNKTILQYLLKPIHASLGTAFTER